MTAALVSDELINKLIARPEAVREFPCLHTTAPARRPPCCGRPGRAVDYNGIKRALAGMPDARKAALKKLLGVDACRFIFREGDRVADVTF